MRPDAWLTDPFGAGLGRWGGAPQWYDPIDPPVNLTPPVAAGIVRIGNTLTTDDGVWDLPATFTYQWTRDGVPIVGATSSSYVPVAADIGPLIACEVTATNTAGSAMEPSNNLASPWRDILVARPGVLIYDHTDPYCNGGASVGDPVSEIRTVDGVVIGTQAPSGSRPTRTADGLYFVTDDWMDLAAHASMAIGAHTIVFGASDMDAPTTPNSTNIRTVFSAAENTANHIAAIAINHPSPSYNRILYEATSGSANVSFATSKTAVNIAIRAGAASGAIKTTDLDDLSTVATGTRPATVPVYTFASLGVRRLASATFAQYFVGDLRHFALHDEQWDDADVAVYAACAVAAGVM